jgi:hypothetical protein
MTITIQNITKQLAPSYKEMKQKVTEAISHKLTNKSFVFLSAHETYAMLFNETPDLQEAWRGFQDSWNRLQQDTFMADGGKYRFRRHAVYQLKKHERLVSPTAYRPHYQSLDHNGLNGGVARYFSPIEPETCNNPVLINTLAMCRDIFCQYYAECNWYIEVHQFRIETCSGTALPTPEGVHRDGVNFVFMMMINRQQVSGGSTLLYDQAGVLLHQQTLKDAMETAFINDERIYHGVSPVIPKTPGSYGYRDMLVITFRKA